MYLNIEVTQKDIKNGVVESLTCCPIARAVRRATRRAVVEVGPTVDVLLPNDPEDLCDQKAIACLSKTLQTFVERFDTGKPVKPFKARLVFDRNPVNTRKKRER